MTLLQSQNTHRLLSALKVERDTSTAPPQELATEPKGFEK